MVKVAVGLLFVFLASLNVADKAPPPPEPDSTTYDCHQACANLCRNSPPSCYSTCVSQLC